MSALGFKARVFSLLACFLTCVIVRFISGATLADCMEVSRSVAILGQYLDCYQITLSSGSLSHVFSSPHESKCF